jgi:hypothetical protein
VAVFSRGFSIPFGFYYGHGLGASGVNTGFGPQGCSLKTSLITCIMLLRPSFSKLISKNALNRFPGALMPGGELFFDDHVGSSRR